MFMSVVTHAPGVPVYAELAGARVLITGLSPLSGVDLARSFADHKCRLVLQTSAVGPEVDALTALLAESAAETQLFTTELSQGPDAVGFAQGPAQTLGGLDVAINLIAVEAEDLAGRTTLDEIEDLVSEKLLPATLMTKVIANRMRLTLTEGLILNAVVMAPPRSSAEEALTGILRTALAAITRRQAQEWADKDIRINAIGPKGPMDGAHGGACLTSGPDIAALALYLASRKGRQLTGHVFDAEGVAGRGC
ncbi:MAG: SDR family oxidoreductase [Hyphomicrobiaceae bacterium]|nr:SDR family oxidoreductase [Hyphomicrobiaceae bacterium]